MSDKTLRIMLVDDSEADNYFHKLVIEESGLAVEVEDCIEAEKALADLQRAKAGERPMPDLILLDINMPRVDGWQFLDGYADLIPPEARVPVVVMLSTSANPQDRERADGIPHVRGYVSKPLTAEEITQIVNDYLATN